ncbi:MAG: T9SS type A sorting domain-containing protein [Prolixibacteraceae bacterium]|nr:T9SS type A sorting domain-containing protein [Prolixibacteraceae bacterium]
MPHTTGITLRIKGAENAWVSILDTSGKLLLETSQHNNSIKISSLPNGVYLLKVSKGTNVFTQRFVKL